MMRSKAEKIESCVAVGMPNDIIAEVVGCSKDYVRAVRCRVRNKAKYGNVLSPEQQEKWKAYNRARWHANPECRKARNQQRTAYRRRKTESEAPNAVS